VETWYIDKIESSDGFLPVGLSDGAILKNDIHQDQPIKLIDVDLPDNAATRLLGFLTQSNSNGENFEEKKVERRPTWLRALHILG